MSPLIALPQFPLNRHAELVSASIAQPTRILMGKIDPEPSSG
jgi:hypothetical protein